MAKDIRTAPPSALLRSVLRWRRRFARALILPFKWLRARVMPQARTPGEAAFEAYMRENGIRSRYEVQEEGKSRRPDYTIRLRSVRVKVDVKDVEDDMLDVSTDVDQQALSAIAVGDIEDDGRAIEVPVRGGAYDPYGKLRQKVNTARAQFKEFKGTPCAVVLYTEGHGADLRSPEVMLGVMYGNYGVSVPFNPERGDFMETEPELGFQAGGSVLHRRRMSDEARIQNTTISALVTLREVKVGAARLAEYIKQQGGGAAAYSFDPALHARLNVDEVHYGVIVWENAFAANPLPKELFHGPYDEYWSAKDGRAGNILTHRGEVLKWTLDRYPDGVSPFEALSREEPRTHRSHLNLHF